jgi:hypothetical protein
MTNDLYPFTLEDGPQRRDPAEPEAWQRFLDEKCPAPEPRE